MLIGQQLLYRVLLERLIDAWEGYIGETRREETFIDLHGWWPHES